MQLGHFARLLAAFAFAAAAGACTQPREEPPEVARGRAIAVEWCGSCHGAARAAPDFAAISARPGRDHMYLTNFMADLHLPMPTYRLWAEERAAVVAYIRSLDRP